MIFHDLEELLRTTGIPDKYVLAQVVAMRARQLSEHHSRILVDETSGRCINEAVEDVASGQFKVEVSLGLGETALGVCEALHAPLEE